MVLRWASVGVPHPHPPDQEETRLPLDSLDAALRYVGDVATAAVPKGVRLTAGA